jgi:hypothetical protein
MGRLGRDARVCEMTKQTVQNRRVADSIAVGTIGLGLLIVEATMLSLRGRSSHVAVNLLLVPAGSGLSL